MKIPETQWFNVQPNSIEGGFQAGSVSDPNAESRQNMIAATNAAFAWNKRTKESTVDDDIGKLQRWESDSLRHPENGLFSKHGKNAVFVNGNDGETWFEKLPKDREAFIADLTKNYDSDQLALFKKRIQPLTTSYMGTLGGNTIQQGDAWHNQSYSARIDNAYTAAAAAHGDRERDEAFARGEEAVRARADLNGLDEESVSREIFQRKAAVWDVEYHDCYNRGDWSGAEKILTEREKEMDPAKWKTYRDDLNDRIKSFSDYAQGQIDGSTGSGAYGPATTGKLASKVPEGIRNTILDVSSKLGVDAGTMMNLMYVESAKTWNPKIKNPKGSALGLGQFIDKTWKGLVNSPEGRKYGLTMDGRTDPRQAAIATAISLRGYANTLQRNGFQPSTENMYLCHFLGPGDSRSGAIRFLKELQSNPNRGVSDYFSDSYINSNPGYLKRGETISQAFRRVTSAVNSKTAAQYAKSKGTSAVSMEYSPEALRMQYSSQKWFDGQYTNNPYLHQAAMQGFNYGYAGYMAAQQQQQFAEMKVDRENAATYYQMVDDMLSNDKQFAGVSPVFRKSRLKLEGLLKIQGANQETIDSVMQYYDNGGQSGVKTDNKLFNQLATHPEELAKTNLGAYKNKLSADDFNMLLSRQQKHIESGRIETVDKATTESKLSEAASKNGVTWSKLDNAQKNRAYNLFRDEYARVLKEKGSVSAEDAMNIGRLAFGEVVTNQGWAIFGSSKTRRFDMDAEQQFNHVQENSNGNWGHVWSDVLGLPSESVLKNGPKTAEEKKQVALYELLRKRAEGRKDNVTNYDIAQEYYNHIEEIRQTEIYR